MTQSKSVKLPLHEACAKQVDDLIEIFDFFAVQDFMQRVDWAWADFSVSEQQIVNPHIPSVDELKNVSRQLLQTALEQKCECETGGLRAEYLKGNLRLSFVARDLEITPEGTPI